MSATYAGAPVEEVAEVLEAVLHSWETQRDLDVPSTVADDSTCFLLGVRNDDDFAASGEVACGPVRYAADEATGWDLFVLNHVAEGEDIRLELVNGDREVSAPWPEGFDGLGVGGATPNLETALDEPPGEVLTETTMFQASELGSYESQHIGSQPFHAPGVNLHVSSASADRIGSRELRWQPPEGQTFLLLAIEAEMDGGASVTVSVNGRDTPVNSSGVLVVPTPDELADLTFTAHGVSQSYSLGTKERFDVDPRLAGYYVGSQSGALQYDRSDSFDAYVPPLHGRDRGTTMVELAGCRQWAGAEPPLEQYCALVNVELLIDESADVSETATQRSPWLPDRGFAGDDSVWVTLESSHGGAYAAYTYWPLANASGVQLAQYREVELVDYRPTLTDGSEEWQAVETLIEEDRAYAVFNVPADILRFTLAQAGTLNAEDPHLPIPLVEIPYGVTVDVSSEPFTLTF